MASKRRRTGVEKNDRQMLEQNFVTTVFRNKRKIIQTTFIRNKICQERQTFRFSPAIRYNYEYRLLTKVYYTTWDTYTELHA